MSLTMGYFACIGFDIHAEDDLDRTLEELAEGASEEPGPAGTRLQWTDDSGARVSMFLDAEGYGVCAKPGFSSRTTLSCRFHRMLDDPQGCPLCARAIVDVLGAEDVNYPLAVELDDLHRGPIRNEDDGRTSLFVAAFAKSWNVRPSENVYMDVRKHPKINTRSVVPTGQFTPIEDARAEP